MTFTDNAIITNDLVSTFAVLSLMRVSTPMQRALSLLDSDAPLDIAIDTLGMVAFDDAYSLHVAMQQVDTDQYQAIYNEHEAMWHIQDACSAFRSFLRGGLPADPAELRYDEGAAFHIMEAIKLLNPTIDIVDRQHNEMLETSLPLLSACVCPIGDCVCDFPSHSSDRLIINNVACEICDNVNCTCPDEQDDVSDDTLRRYAINCFCIPGFDDCHCYDN